MGTNPGSHDAAGVDTVDLDFEKFLKAATSDSPTDIVEQLRAGLGKRYAKPPAEEMGLVLGRSVPIEKARQLLFAPEEKDMRLYPLLIAMPPPGAPDSHPQRLVQVCALAPLYLVHSKSWELVKPFIEEGGLSRLSAALAHPNPYLCSQAMSALMHITDEDLLFPWHDPPETPDGRGPRQGPYALVWRRMYELSGAGFLPALLAHHRQPPAFPGASHMALRLFAFYVSWMRRHFTADGRLQLSASLLDLLAGWGADAGAEGGEEERALARQLHADFSRFPPASEPAPTPGEEAPGHHLGGLDGGEEDYELRVVAERTLINAGPSAGDEAEQLRQAGNEAFRRGDYTAAVQAYSAALDVPVPTQRLLTEGPRRAAYHANRAAAYMARAAGGKLREGDADSAGQLESVDHGSDGIIARHYEAAVLDCDAALDLDSDGALAAKTCLRKARALIALARAEEAATAAEAGLGKAVEGSETQGELRALLKALRPEEHEAKKECRAAGKDAAEGRAGAKDGASSQEGTASAVNWNAMD
ncbi:hypothetical protein HYH03_017927 [Edaphochlamys debaryana]|uniref:Uncharacterized protein n=1 Tax=Edaphochlamys debaryana TaxID=47281 RepID=A0A836BNT8_9CHLO|nr:hypothetical protein HYH03_017927 [Edaphochlamys debaryana]|eukprot:KAG2483192.1 hypothetical protein HYH03_017927 [Edaphochlamys debaryana]